MSIDCTNASNTVDRRVIRTELGKYFPHLLRYFDFAYGQGSLAVFVLPESPHNGTPPFFGGALLTTWVRQGCCPLSAAFFAIAIHPILEKLKTEFPMLNIMAIWTMSTLWALLRMHWVP